MLLPWGSDAPLYHLPIATVSMIVANVLAFAGMLWLEAAVDEGTFLTIFNAMALEYGSWWPWQWITSNFIHGGFIHLLGNMFCLWGFGFVVEGKIGWWRFLVIYFGIGITQCAIEQTLMLPMDEGGSIGASSIIYGLMAICMIWAPENEMNCILLLGFRIITFDATLYIIAIGFLLLQIATAMFAGLSWGSQILHLMGAGLGFAVGIVMLKKGWVDCEGWDLFSVWSGKEHSVRDEEREQAESLLDEAHQLRLQSMAAKTQSGDNSLQIDDLFDEDGAADFAMNMSAESVSIEDIQSAIQAADPQRAFELYRELAADPIQLPPQRELLQTVTLFHQQKRWGQSVPAMAEYLAHFTDREKQIRLKLAQILIQADQRPAQAMAVLSKLDSSTLNNKEQELFNKLRAHADKMKSTIAEPDVQDW